MKEKKYRMNYALGNLEKGDIVPRDGVDNWAYTISFNEKYISCNDKCLQQLLDIGLITEVKNLITIKGKEYSEDTIHKALKEYVD